MRTLVMAFLLLAPAAMVARNRRTSVLHRLHGAGRGLETVKKQSEDAWTTFYKAAKDAYELAEERSQGARIQLRKAPSQEHSFLAALPGDHREKSRGPEAIEALRLTLLFSFGPKPGPRQLKREPKPIELLRDHYATKPAIKGFVPMLVRYDDDDARALLADIIFENPEPAMFRLPSSRNRPQNSARWSSRSPTA